MDALNPYTSLVYDFKLLESSLPVDARGIRIERLRTIEQSRFRNFISEMRVFIILGQVESFFFLLDILKTFDRKN